MNLLFPDHKEFVEALGQNRISAVMLPKVAMEVVRSEPEVFGVTSWRLMRAVSRLPWLIWIGLVLFSGWKWKWLVLDFFVAWILGHCGYKAEAKTAVDTVLTRCIKDPVFYEQMLLLGKIKVFEAGVESK